jgi:hypothetical protein
MVVDVSSKEIAEKTIELNNVAKVARFYGITDNGIRYRLRLEGVILRDRVIGARRVRKWARVSDKECQQAFIAQGGNIEATASVLGVAESYVQDVINRLYHELVK